MFRHPLQSLATLLTTRRLLVLARLEHGALLAAGDTCGTGNDVSSGPPTCRGSPKRDHSQGRALFQSHSALAVAADTSLRGAAGATDEGAVEAESNEEREAAVVVVASEALRACDMVRRVG